MRRLFSFAFILWFGLSQMIQAWGITGGIPAATGKAGHPQATTREVTSAADSGAGTLRQAMLDAAAGDTIIFNTVTFPTSTPAVIYLRSTLPAVVVNGLTIDASNAGVILDGSQAPSSGVHGLVLQARTAVIQGLTIRAFSGNGITISGGAASNVIGGSRYLGSGPNHQGNLIIQNGATGIEISGTGSNDNIIRGNNIGIDPAVAWAVGNKQSGISIWDKACFNIIGDADPSGRNLISGNGENGVWIGGTGTNQNQVIGNYIGTTADGMQALPNWHSGVSIPIGAWNNQIGGLQPGQGNVISGNKDYGIYISDAGTGGTQIYGNLIGLNALGNNLIGQGMDGIILRNGTINNTIGKSRPGRNWISGNSRDGIRIEGIDTANNVVQNNYIGADFTGSKALSNGMHGVDLADDTHDNLIGGNRLAGEGNLLSGNYNHGLVITFRANNNTVTGNIIGPDATGTFSLGNQNYGGIDIAEGAHDNTIGGLTPGLENQISGNLTDGIALFDNTGTGTTRNKLLGNLVGVTLDGLSPLPNQGYGIFNVSKATWTLIQGNTVANNQGYGVWTSECDHNTITQNSIYSNTLGGIRSNCLPPPTLRAISTQTIAGTTVPNATVEFFSDDDSQGRYYEGSTTADSSGNFTFTKTGGFQIPNVTAISTDPNGNTSTFSRPVHLGWTIMLYMNGDNDLSESIFDTLDNLIAARPSPYANVLAMVDGYTQTVKGTTTYTGTRIFEISGSNTISIPVDLGGGLSVPGELDLGKGETLQRFVQWALASYPASYSMLSIIDHGGGWAPNISEPISNTLPMHIRHFSSGGSGLSWDFSDNYDYLTLPEVTQVFDQITSGGSQPLNVVFFDVCLMGMAEVAYQIRDYSQYFISSQNLGWAPVGPNGRYVRLLNGQRATTTPAEMASLMVQSYADSLPPNETPYTISAVELAKMDALAQTTRQLGEVISATLNISGAARTLGQAYLAAQKIDYDSDFFIEPTADGFVDLYDFAERVLQQYSSIDIQNAANALRASISQAVIAERHASGSPWKYPERVWNLDNVHGLSIFLPLGEDLLLTEETTGTLHNRPAGETVPIHLRDLYTQSQLSFVGSTGWDQMIASYYRVVASPVPTGTTGHPTGGLILPDVTPPQTVITVTGARAVGKAIHIEWSASDTQSGVAGAALWYKPTSGPWVSTGLSQNGSSGSLDFTLTQACINGVAVSGTDQAGNLEPPDHGANTVYIYVDYCQWMPIASKPPNLTKGVER